MSSKVVFDLYCIISHFPSRSYHGNDDSNTYNDNANDDHKSVCEHEFQNSV
jgi:hypothetical protein